MKRDDVSISNTAKAIFDSVRFVVTVYNPVDGTEELTQSLSDKEKSRFQHAIADLANDSAEAVNAEERRRGTQLWAGPIGATVFRPLMMMNEEKQKRENADRLAAFYTLKKPTKPWGSRLSWWSGNEPIKSFFARRRNR